MNITENNIECSYSFGITGSLINNKGMNDFNKDNTIMTRLCEKVVPAASVILLKSSL
jgi:hypothetical protein